MAADSQKHLFGGPYPWSPTDWTSSDDRVRGGSSFSTLIPSPDKHSATFKGNLDITTLGGAGFASQRTTAESSWDLAAYDGLELDILKSDGKLYTLTLKDEILPNRPDGRERSSLSWEAEVRVNKGVGEKVVVKWEDLRPMYRGKEVEGVEPLDLGSVKRVGIMMRRYVSDSYGFGFWGAVWT
ncbi:NADH:ubiquinone oxidoreductase intermediate-associated protein 30, partial [Aspergillus varians]